jgi:pyruvate-ferredoxin/flavodoxin oxidoreductase
VTNLSLPVKEEIDTAPEGTISCKFWGLGSDGTVGANKNSIKIIGDNTDQYAQAYFAYDSKKSGGVTVSHLRFGKKPIRSTYLINKADFVACHNPSYLVKYDMVSDLKDNGTFLINCAYTPEELDNVMPAAMKRFIAQHNISVYTIDGVGIGAEIGLGNRINMVMQAAFFKLANIIPIEDAVKHMKKAVYDTYGKKGDKIINMNLLAIDKGIEGINKVEVPASWADAVDTPKERTDVPEFIEKILEPINRQQGDKLPVSTFVGREDGTFPVGTSTYEKRGIAIDVPLWKIDDCIQCNQCSYVCPHAAIRPFLLTEDEVKNAPAGFESKKAIGKDLAGLSYRLQVSPLDCTGCGSCVEVCPSKVKALVMMPLASQMGEVDNWEYAVKLEPKDNVTGKESVKGSQFQVPLFEFSGACAGCGETPYLKLVTQLFGERMMASNATGCTSIYSASAPSMPYCTNKNGHGPAWANSLFEDSAEYGFGMYLGVKQIRNKLAGLCKELLQADIPDGVKEAVNLWLAKMFDGEGSKPASAELIKALESFQPVDSRLETIVKEILDNREFLVKKSQWIYGGDGWAYDIGYGGLDHVLASNEDVNVLVLDTEVYSNTGGQSSKSTPTGAVAQFAASGKVTKKKDLGMMAISYGYVYVAQVAMGASQTQLIKALVEAERYPGPSLIIAYAPCINHGLKLGMGCSQLEQKNAVAAGYWHLYRYNPLLKKEGKNPFILDSKEPTASYREFIMGETRYSSLVSTFPERAKVLFEQAEESARERYENYKRLANG